VSDPPAPPVPPASRGQAPAGLPPGPATPDPVREGGPSPNGSVPPAGLPTVLRIRRRGAPVTRDRGWILAVLPAFPLLLLILRVWFLSGQDPQTMVLLLQHSSSLGLVSSLIVANLWVLPAVFLVFRCLRLFLQVSAVEVGIRDQGWLTRWVPGWLALPSTLLACLTWQLRFLPSLVMLVVLIVVLTVRLSPAGNTLAGQVTGAVVPVLAGLLVLGWTAPGVLDALGSGEPSTAALLAVPPVAGFLLAGPLPWTAARWLIPGVALVLGLVIPLMAGARYLNTPVLPRIALTTEHPLSHYLDAGVPTQASQRAGAVHRNSRVLVGDLVAVDDHSFVLLTLGGRVVFVPVSQVRKEVLCTVAPDPPSGSVSVHGWHTEMSLLAWAGPQPATVSADPSCRV